VPPEIRGRVAVIRTLFRVGSDNEPYVALSSLGPTKPPRSIPIGNRCVTSQVLEILVSCEEQAISIAWLHGLQ
jgi:hypothetical protein